MQGNETGGQILKQDGGRHFYFADGKQISKLNAGLTMFSIVSRLPGLTISGPRLKKEQN